MAVQLRRSLVLWNASARRAIASHGIDLYREICCALGTEADFPQYLAKARSCGSKVEEPVLAGLFESFDPSPFNLQALDQCGFLHFGSYSPVNHSGHRSGYAGARRGASQRDARDGASYIGTRITGADCWVEGCRLHAPLMLRGRNVVVGIDVHEPFELPERACLDLAPGFDRQGRESLVHPLLRRRRYFQRVSGQGATFCGWPLHEWLQRVGAPGRTASGIRDQRKGRTLWNARVFPAGKGT